ncbi:ferrochelatase [Nocardioides montaniterrae]
MNAAPPYDAILLLSFGGPEGPEDVVPFLENVTRGRGIPRERLEQVGEHYFLFGGKSPINDQNRALIAALETDLADNGIHLPVYWGNRNWAPYAADTIAQMAADGIKRAAVVTTSAYSSWSSCRQYLGNIEAAVAAVPGAPVLEKIRPYFDHPGFVDAFAQRTMDALEQLPDDLRHDARLVMVTHSIPTAMNDESGPDGGAYVAQHEEIAQKISFAVWREVGGAHISDLAYCSRSGSPRTPWLEPDVNDHLEALAAEGVKAVVIVPIGFVSDHMEVVYDLDTEALATAERLGITAVRAGTPGTHRSFVAALRELVVGRAVAEKCCGAGCCLPRA